MDHDNVTRPTVTLLTAAMFFLTTLDLAAALELDPDNPHPFVEGNAGFRQWINAIHDCAEEVLEQKLRASH